MYARSSFSERVSVAGLDLFFVPNVVFSAGGCGNFPVPLLAFPKSVEKTVPMDQRGLLAKRHFVGTVVMGLVPTCELGRWLKDGWVGAPPYFIAHTDALPHHHSTSASFLFVAPTI